MHWAEQSLCSLCRDGGEEDEGDLIWLKEKARSPALGPCQYKQDPKIGLAPAWQSHKSLQPREGKHWCSALREAGPGGRLSSASSPLL